MPVDLPQGFKDEIEKLHGSGGMVWLLEVTLDLGSASVPPVVTRICDGSTQITWPVDDPAATVWDPFPFDFSPVQQTQEGDLSSIDLTVDNTTRYLMRWLHDGNGLEGNPVRLFCVPRNSLGVAYPNHVFRLYELEIAGATANYEAVTFRLSMPNWLSIASPTDRYVPERCRLEFGSDRCGYVINAFAAFTRCPKTIEACIERGDDMEARGLPRVLPGNHGGHPGVSRQR